MDPYRAGTIDALHAAREAMEWAEDPALEQGACFWYFAKAQAYAAIAQAEAAREQAAALERIADALYVGIRGEQIQITDVLIAIHETLDEQDKQDE